MLIVMVKKTVPLLIMKMSGCLALLVLGLSQKLTAPTIDRQMTAPLTASARAHTPALPASDDSRNRSQSLRALPVLLAPQLFLIQFPPF